jgi:hypothetical protein
MKRLELILAIVIALAILMKLTLMPSAGIFLFFSMMLLSGIYYPFGFAFFNNIDLIEITKKASYKEISIKRIVGAISAGIGLSIICTGILFKISHYQGASLMLYIGLDLTTLVFIISLFRFLKSKDHFYITIYKRFAIIGAIGVFMAVLPPLTIDKIRYHNYPAYIKALEAYTKDPQNDTLKEKMLQEYRKAVVPNADLKENTKGMSQEPN